MEIESGPGNGAARASDVGVPAEQSVLPGHLVVPDRPLGVVLFAHGSGSDRHSPRNRAMAAVLHRARVATLLFDLLTAEETASRANVVHVERLAGRLVDATRWTRGRPGLATLPIGYFGASTGAGAALWAAAVEGANIAAVVSRGGRPDLAETRLGEVCAATLLIVGGDDPVVLGHNQAARSQLRCECRLAVIPGASHLFEEPGTLQQAAAVARDWFTGHFGVTGDARDRRGSGAFPLPRTRPRPGDRG
ncbi:MAG: dienelactone hydrolase family protein [Acidimicrobiales bacterium]